MNMLRRHTALRRKSPLRQKPWQRQEAKTAKDFGGKVVAGSGNKWFNPGDVKTSDFLIQSKHTTRKGYRITVQEWLKTCNEANQSGKLPMQVIEFEDGTEIVLLRKPDVMSWFTEGGEENAKDKKSKRS